MRLAFDGDGVWVQVRDGDGECIELFSRHYSKYHYRDGRRPKRFVGPGERIVLVTADGKAMFVWRKFKDASGQKGINCAIFRNEGDLLSSNLILEAMKFAEVRWPGVRLYTYVDPKKIRSVNPGYCFKMAGWSWCGITKIRKLLIMEFNKETTCHE